MNLISYQELPEWMQDNDCIISGYRPQLHSLSSCVKSVFALHTETGNIWTHALGAALFVLLAAYVFAANHALMSALDVVVIGSYFVCIICCLVFSSAYHTFTCHSPHVAQLCKRFDYCGISLLITGSFVSWTYYAFYTDSLARTVYVGLVTCVGAGVGGVSLLRAFGSSQFRVCRATVFALFGVSAVAPVAHFFFWSRDYVSVSATSMLSFGAYYLAGAVVYAFRFPENLFPGRFDLAFHSHQIFHVFVVVAALIHCFNIQEIALKRLAVGGGAGGDAGGAVVVLVAAGAGAGSH